MTKVPSAASNTTNDAVTPKTFAPSPNIADNQIVLGRRRSASDSAAPSILLQLPPATTASDDALKPTGDKTQTKKQSEQTSNFGSGRIRKDDKFMILQQWLLDNGAEFPKMEIRSYNASSSGKIADLSSPPSKDMLDDEKKVEEIRTDESDDNDDGERGVHTKCFVDKDEVVVRIPANCIIFAEMGEATEIGKKLRESKRPDFDGPTNSLMMIVYMLWDRKVNKDKSLFKPYYDTLPQTMDHLPIYWTDEELDAFDGSFMLDLIDQQRQAMRHNYDTICEIAPEFAEIATFEEYQWGRCVVVSRNFSFNIVGKKTNGMVPFGDMLNHQLNPRASQWTFDEEKGAFTITTLTPIDAGCQLTDSYGNKSNHRWLLNYGFALEDNTQMNGACANEVVLHVNPKDYQRDPLLDEKVKVWQRGLPLPCPENSPSPGGRRITLRMTGSDMSREVLSMFRLLACNKNELDLVCSGDLRWHTASRSAMPVPTGGPSPFCPSALGGRGPASMLGPSGRGPPPMLGPGGRGPAPMLGTGGRGPPPMNGHGGQDRPGGRGPHPIYGPAGRGPPPIYGPGGRGSPMTGAGGRESPPSYGPTPPMFGPGGRGFSVPSGLLHLKHQPTWQAIVTPINPRNERAATENFLELLNKTLSAYPTTIEQDEKDLANEVDFPPFTKKRNAKILVYGEKKIIHRHIHWCNVALKVLDLICLEVAAESSGGELLGLMTGRRTTTAGSAAATTVTTVERRRSSVGMTKFSDTVRTLLEEEGIEEMESREQSFFKKHCEEQLCDLRTHEINKLRERLSGSGEKDTLAKKAKEEES